MSSGCATMHSARSQVSSSGSSGAGFSMRRTYARGITVGECSAGQREGEPAARTVRVPVDPDRATVPLHDLTARRETDAVPRIGAVHLRVHREDRLTVLRWDAQSVVGDVDQPVGVALLDGDLASGCTVGVAVLEGVLDQVLEHLPQ